MKFLIAALALAAVASADVSHLRSSDASVQVLREAQDVGPESFQYEYELSNGAKAQASGQLNHQGEGAALVVQGSNQFVAPSGEQFQLTYIADENGYQPQGAHLPTPPPTQPIPEYILRSLEWNAAHPVQEEQARFAPAAQASAFARKYAAPKNKLKRDVSASSTV